MKKLAILILAVTLISGVAQALTAADVETFITSESGYKATYLELTNNDGGPGDTRDGLTLITATDQWYPDGSDGGLTVNENCLDEDDWNHATAGADDFLATITGLTPDTDYTLFVTVLGGRPYWAGSDDFSWGTVADGSAVNLVEQVADQEGIIQMTFDTNANNYAVPLGMFTSDGNGQISIWLGGGVAYGTTGSEDNRTQFDGLAVATPVDIAWNPDPADGASNVPLSTDLRWNGPTDANEFWTYEVYFKSGTGDLSGVTPIIVNGGADPNVPNAAIAPLSLGEYTWRVDSVNPNGPTVHQGDSWTFTAGVPLPTLVNPQDGTGGYGLELLLQWDSDDDSVNSGLIQKHRVVLNNITDGTSGVSYDKAAAQEDYYLGNPDMWDIVFYGKDYTWQVIELGAGDQVLAVGPLWSFSTVALDCSLSYDLDGNCKITLADLALLATEWLGCGASLGGEAIPYPEKDPCTW